MKQWLAQGDPILLAIPVMPEFDEPAGPYCIVDLPNQGKSRGGHAITIVGYNDNIGSTGKGGFKIVNSWGPEYGCQGFAYLTYNWFKQYANEAWWMRDIRTGSTNTVRDFTIFNDGTATLTINNISKQGSSAWLELSLPKAVPLPLEPGENLTIGLVAKGNSNSVANYNETVVIASDDSTQSTVTVNVTLQTGVTASAAPNAASNPNPANGATEQPTANVNLSWISNNPGTTALLYDTRLEPNSPPARIVCNDTPGSGCKISNLWANTTYYWRVVTSDGVNTTLGPVWQFRTLTTADWVPRVYLPIIIK